MPNSNDFNHFDYNPTDIHIDRSLFNMDHSIKFSGNVGDVIPFDIFECLPGDTWSVDTSKVVRLQPLVTPIMDEVILDVSYFFVPHRLVWNHWKNFCGENTTSPWAPHTEYTIPQIKAPETTGWNIGTIADYLGAPVGVPEASVSALPFRSYAIICDQWFRSESLMNPVSVHIDDTNRYGKNTGDQTTDIEFGGKPFVACKFFDYFTSALPSPQRGDPAAVFPFATYAPVVSINKDGETLYDLKHPYSNDKTKFGNNKLGLNGYYQGPPRLSYLDSSSEYEVQWKYKDITGNPRNIYAGDGAIKADANSYSPSSIGDAYFNNLYAALNASTFFVNDLRTAFAVQRYLEKSARYGGRYVEFVKGFFGVESPDARLQRSEYIGGSRISLNINQVEQTSATVSGTTPLGNVAGMSVTADMNSDFTYSCTEHGYIIGCSVLRYHHTYSQGCNRLWLRDSFEEFYLPTFAFLGEQPVYLEEIYWPLTGHGGYPTMLNDRKKVVFGYQERWSEYRYLPNRTAGLMRPQASNSLDVWHLGDNYSEAPTLSPEWIREDKGMLDRCLAVTSAVSDQAIFDFYVKVKAARPLPLYSIPGMIDHY